MKKLIVFGVGDGARTVLSVLREQADSRVACFTLDRSFLREREFANKPVVPLDELVSRFPPADHEAIVVIGYHNMNRVRQQKYEELKAAGYDMANIVDRRNDFDLAALTGDNCLILQRQLFHQDVEIGSNVVIWSGCHIGDRVKIGSHIWLGGMVCLNGDARVQDHCILGSQCTISNNVTVKERSFVGAMALINKSTEPDSVHVVSGTPALGMKSDRYLPLVGR